jgi:hypothetical protein
MTQITDETNLSEVGNLNEWHCVFRDILIDIREGNIADNPTQWLTDIFPDEESLKAFNRDVEDMSDNIVKGDFSGSSGLGMFFQLGYYAHSRWSQNA